MEHFRSTLATTAAAVFGLVVAAHVLYPGDPEAQARPRRAVATVEAPVPTAWVDPPAEFRLASLAERADTAGLLAPRLTMVLPPEVAAAQPLPGTLIPAERTTRAEAAPRRRTVQRERRVRQAALDRPVAAQSAPSAATGPTPTTESGVDPIGALIRGLDLDG